MHSAQCVIAKVYPCSLKWGMEWEGEAGTGEREREKKREREREREGKKEGVTTRGWGDRSFPLVHCHNV